MSMALLYLNIHFLEKCLRFINNVSYFDNINILKQCYLTHD